MERLARFAAVAGLVTLLSTSGCVAHIGPEKVHPDGTMECRGFTVAIGDASSCGTRGGTVSDEFVTLFRGLAYLVRSLMPGGPAAPAE